MGFGKPISHILVIIIRRESKLTNKPPHQYKAIHISRYFSPIITEISEIVKNKELGLYVIDWRADSEVIGYISLYQEHRLRSNC